MIIQNVALQGKVISKGTNSTISILYYQSAHETTTKLEFQDKVTLRRRNTTVTGC